MTTPMPAAAWMSAERPCRSRWVTTALNVSIILTCVFSAAFSLMAYDHRVYGTPSGEPIGNGTMLLVLFAVVLAIATCLRHRALAVIALALCIPPLVLPLDALPALITMASCLVWVRSARTRLAVWGAAAVATFVSLWRDTRAGSAGSSFFNGLFAGPNPAVSHGDMPLAQLFLLWFLVVGITTGVAVWRRSRHAVATAQHVTAEAQEHREQAQQRARELNEQLAFQLEREDLAREVHDVLGHRLSILAMQANVLDAVATDSGNDDVRDLARQIQAGSAGSMNDLRSLLTMLRSPMSHEGSADLNDVAQLVSESADLGVPVTSAIFVQGSERLNPIVSRSAHRITAELLSNVRKHAAGRSADLRITGSPAEGLTIRCTNRLGNSSPSMPGTSSGLSGIRRRTESLGGRFHAAPDAQGELFVAEVWLPFSLPGDREPGSGSAETAPIPITR